MGLPSDPQRQPKVPVIRRPGYTVSLEQADTDECFVHCDVTPPWTATLLRNLRADWDTLLELHGGPLRALHTPGDAKHLKFLTTFGFHYAASFVSPTGTPTDVYTT